MGDAGEVRFTVALLKLHLNLDTRTSVFVYSRKGSFQRQKYFFKNKLQYNIFQFQLNSFLSKTRLTELLLATLQVKVSLEYSASIF